MTTIYNRNFKKLEKIFGETLKDVCGKYTYLKLEANGFMDLHADIIGLNKIALSHTYEQGGDFVPDPDMEIEINFEAQTIEALSFQDTYTYQRVYDYDANGEKTSVRPAVKKDLNNFLAVWLKNIREQEHKVTDKRARA